MDRKYRLTDETTMDGDKVLYRIECVRSFSDVMEGDKGGFVESEENLSHQGDAWIYDGARVLGGASVSGNARIRGKSYIRDFARIGGNAEVLGYCSVISHAEISGNAIIDGYSCIGGDAVIKDSARVYNSHVGGGARIFQYAVIESIAVEGNVMIHGNVAIHGATGVYFAGESVIASERDYLIFKKNWGQGQYVSWTRSDDMWHIGCFFSGSDEEVIAYSRLYSETKEKYFRALVDCKNAIRSIDGDYSL